LKNTITSLLSLSIAIVISGCSSEQCTFAGEFLGNPSAIGAIAPSSEELAEMMVESIDPENSIVIELGAGTGPFTEKLVAKIPKDKLFIVENNATFYEHLVKRFPDQAVLCVDACELDQHIPKHLHGKINVVVSGLPFRSLPQEVASKILSSLKKVCAVNFKLIQFTYFNEPPLPLAESEMLGVVPTYYKLSPNNTPAAHVWIYNPIVVADTTN
jgi:phosphatidylethanolamine/phosphatidyl-N-methylethanolamine N-methyltransferase